MAMSDRVIVINRGVIQQIGTRHPLLLPARKLAGDALGVLAQVHRLQNPFHLLLDDGLIQLFNLQGIGHVVKDRHAAALATAILLLVIFANWLLNKLRRTGRPCQYPAFPGEQRSFRS